MTDQYVGTTPYLSEAKPMRTRTPDQEANPTEVVRSIVYVPDTYVLGDWTVIRPTAEMLGIKR